MAASLGRGSRFEAILTEKLAGSAATLPSTLTRRRIVGRVQFPGKATAVVGMRRAGKTYFLHQLRTARVQAGTSPDHVPYVNFEDERLAGMEAEHLSLVPEIFYRRFPTLRSQDDNVLWCLDEIQRIPGWESFVRRMLDSESADVMVSGSSAELLSKEIATAMRGRAWTVVVRR